MTDDLDIIARYPDEPYEEEGFTSAAFKASFDRGAKLCKAAINRLVGQLNGETTGAASVGFNPIENVPAYNVQSAIETLLSYLLSQMQSMTHGSVSDGGITAPKLASNAVTTPKIEDGAVTAPKLAPGAVGWVKVSAEDFYMDTTATGSVSGNSISITSQSFFYNAAAKLMFWRIGAIVTCTEAGVFFMPKLHGDEKYHPFLEQGETSAEYFAGCDNFDSAEIGRDTQGNGSYLYTTMRKTGNSIFAQASGFYICAGE